jgi:hypothetical protein
MAESFDRELELTKLQITAEHSSAELQIYVPLAFSGAFVLFVFAFSILMQSSYGSIIAQYLAEFVLVVVIVLLAVLLFLYVNAYAIHKNDIRELDSYVTDFKACKPLPTLTEMCHVSEKPRLYERILGYRISRWDYLTPG